MSRGPDAEALLRRALATASEAAGCAVEIAASVWTRWASATFAGAQHRITLTAAASPELDRWIAGLPEAEFDLRGHLVADLVVERIARDGARVTAELEVLTVEER